MSGLATGLISGTRVLPQTTSLVQIDQRGELMYWIVFGFFSVSACAIMTMTCFKPPATRSHGYCTAAILTTASIAYLSMATQGGYAWVRVYDQTNTARSIYYARYVDWAITTPLLLLDILLLAGLSIGDTLWILFADIAMIVTGLFGALLPNRYKWGWFGLGCVFMLVIIYGLLFQARKAAMLRSKKIGATYSALALYLIVLWSIYPIAWGLAEGSNTISSRAEAIFYGCLDLATKFVFGWAIIILAEPVSAKQRSDDEDRHGAPLPSVLESPVNRPFLGAIGGLGGGNDGKAAGGTTKHRTVAPASEPVLPAGTEAPAAHNGAARVPGPGVTAHPGAARPHAGATGPVTAHTGDGTANV